MSEKFLDPHSHFSLFFFLFLPKSKATIENAMPIHKTINVDIIGAGAVVAVFESFVSFL